MQITPGTGSGAGEAGLAGEGEDPTVGPPERAVLDGEALVRERRPGRQVGVLAGDELRLAGPEVDDVLERGRLHRTGGPAEHGGRKDVAHGDDPRRVDRLAAERAEPRRDPRVRASTERDDVGVEADLGVLEVG